MSITTEDLIWLAGFVDGEGFIGYMKGRDKRHKTPQYRLAIKITNTDYVVLEWIRSRFGGTISNMPTNIAKEHKNKYQWSLYCSKATELIEKLKPYLKIKAAQGRLI